MIFEFKETAEQCRDDSDAECDLLISNGKMEPTNGKTEPHRNGETCS